MNEKIERFIWLLLYIVVTLAIGFIWSWPEQLIFIFGCIAGALRMASYYVFKDKRINED